MGHKVINVNPCKNEGSSLNLASYCLFGSKFQKSYITCLLSVETSCKNLISHRRMLKERPNDLLRNAPILMAHISESFSSRILSYCVKYQVVVTFKERPQSYFKTKNDYLVLQWS